MNKNNDSKTAGYYAGLFLLSVLIVLCFSWTTSPLFFGKYLSFDSQIFQIIGKYWLQGYLPYVDLWDNKGPIIFLINAIGYQLIGNSVGVLLLQIVCLFASVVFIYKSFNLFSGPLRSFCLSAVVILSIAINWDGGNMCEEYLLPLLSAFYYILLKHLYSIESDKKKLLYIIAFIGGMILSFSLLTRLTNACGVCASCGVILALLLIDRKWNNLARFAVWFVIGFAILTLPFVIYFASHDALQEMWYSTVTYNIEYMNYPKTHTVSWLNFYLKDYNCIFLLAAALMLLVFKRDRESLLWAITTLAPMIWFVNGTGFGHYGIIVLPYSFVSIILLLRIIDMNQSAWSRKLAHAMIGLMLLVIIGGVSFRLFSSYKQFIKTPCKETFTDCFFEENDIDTNSFVSYNCDWTLYLRRNIKPGMKYFSFQDELIDHGPSIEDKVYQAITSSRVKWILVGLPIRNERIKQYINDNYVIINQKNRCTLYRLKEDPSVIG